MTGRSEARIFTSIWNEDGDFRQVSPMAKLVYLFLVSQRDLTHCGVIPYRPARWAPKLGITVEDVAAAVAELELARFAVTDTESGELLVRSLIRRDKVLRQPFLFTPLAEAVMDVDSVRIVAVLLAELVRVRAEGDVNAKVTGDLDALIVSLEKRVARHPDSDPDRHPDTHSDTHSEWHADTHPGPHADTHPESQSGSHADTQQGIGGSYGSNHRIPLSPIPGSPSPRTSAREHALWPAPVADLQTGEEGDQDPAKNLDSLVAEIRGMRPAWSSTSIRRALEHPDVIERGWDRARPAMLAVAADPASQQPGRLAHDGPWWNDPGAQSDLTPWPDWCGECFAPDHRWIDLPDGTTAHCSRCHPSRAQEVS